jgi:hypothetical protein
MKIAGHSSATVSQRYVHATPEAVERAFWRLETLNAQAGQFPADQPEIRQLPAVEGPIAQWLEQRTHNPLVPGSSPGGPTKVIKPS